MYDKKAESLAEHFGILDKMQALEADLLTIEGVSDIDFDIDNYDEIPQVILIPRYSVPDGNEPYYNRRAVQLAKIIIMCEAHGLLCSPGDKIEDYGEHWYIVRNCGVGWPRVRKEEHIDSMEGPAADAGGDRGAGL